MNMINEAVSFPGMLPFDTMGMGLYEPPKRYIFKMPRVVPEQKEKFESDDLFKKLSRDCEVSLIWNNLNVIWIKMRARDTLWNNHESDNSVLMPPWIIAFPT